MLMSERRFIQGILLNGIEIRTKIRYTNDNTIGIADFLEVLYGTDSRDRNTEF